MALRGSISRLLFASTRPSSLRPSPTVLPRLRSPPLAPTLRRPSPAPRRSLGEIGCVQLLLPLQAVAAAPRLTSHLSVNVRALCELSHGRNGKDG